MLAKDQIDSYFAQGYLLVEDVLTPEELGKMQDIAHDLIDKSRHVTESNDVYDLDEGHSPEQPRLTRVKLPHKQHPFFWDVLRNSRITEVMRQLLGANVLIQTSKLNTKAPGGGAAVEWHQDWAFYPHTNDDLLAVGVMLDDVGEDNGPLMVFPGSHRGPIFDHHSGGVFAGTMDLEACGLDLKDAVKLMAPAGSISLHHARIVHGSAPNRSTRDRGVIFWN